MQGFVVHPAEHQDLAGVVLLHDCGDQAGGVALEPRGDRRIELGRAHPSILPDARSGFRQPDGDRAALLDAAVETHRATVRSDDRGDDGQPEAGSATSS
jgi:hypothetical protein